MKRVGAAKILVIGFFIIGLFGTTESKAEGFFEPFRKFNTGIELNMIYTGDIIGNCVGGDKRGTAALGLLDCMLSADMDDLCNWPGASVFIDGIVSHGDDPGTYTGDSQGVSNIAADNTVKLYEFWLQQEFFDGNCYILAGLYDLNCEFDVNEFAGVFLNSSFGMGPDLSQSGVNGAPTYPNPAPALRIKWQFLDNYYMGAVITDGIPGNSVDLSAFSVKLSSEEGALLCTELGYLTNAERMRYSPLKYGRKQQRRKFLQAGHSGPQRGRRGRYRSETVPPDIDLPCRNYCKLALGSWYYTAEFDGYAMIDDIKSYSRDWGAYLLGEKVLWSTSARAGQILGGFFRVGYANPKMNPVSHYCGCGLMFSGRSHHSCYHQLGLAFAAAWLSENYHQTILTGGNESDKLELVVELVYRSQINKWMTVQPDVQYIVNPGYIPQNPDSIVLGLRFDVSI